MAAEDDFLRRGWVSFWGLPNGGSGWSSPGPPKSGRDPSEEEEADFVVVSVVGASLASGASLSSFPGRTGPSQKPLRALEAPWGTKGAAFGFRPLVLHRQLEAGRSLEAQSLDSVREGLVAGIRV